MPREVISPEEKQLTHLLTIARTAENMLLEVIRELIRMREEERKQPRMLMATPEEARDLMTSKHDIRKAISTGMEKFVEEQGKTNGS